MQKKTPSRYLSSFIPLTERELVTVELNNTIYAQIRRTMRIGDTVWKETRAIPIARIRTKVTS